MLRSLSPRTKKLSAEDLIAQVRSYRARNPVIDFRTRQFLADNKVYLSLTTSPHRIQHVLPLIKAINLTHIEKIIVNLPDVFGRDGGVYDIPEALERHPKVLIHRFGEDLGPASKIIPSLELAEEQKWRGIVISIDDDIAYPTALIHELIMASAWRPESVIGGSGQNATFWGLNSEMQEQFVSTRSSRVVEIPDGRLIPVDILEGFGAIAYPIGKLNTSLVREWVDLSIFARVSDDLVLSSAMSLQNLPRYRIGSDYFRLSHIRPLPYGMGPDALHRGAGLNGSAPLLRNLIDSNRGKYQRAADQIAEELRSRLDAEDSPASR
ncbi:MAG TPA: hypothetical protein VM901_04605 [Bdellovibrionota bacterium]|nr:hypothetical protein [Bdellovibrionota bacterium]